jgi:S-adenosylmethionine-dependent methyltransferase
MAAALASLVRALRHPRATFSWALSRVNGERSLFGKPIPRRLRRNHSAGPQEDTPIWDLRLAHDRARIVPWLDAVRPLRGLRVLEVGSGSGASTIALAEQGALITAIDIDEAALAYARGRCSAHGLSAEFRNLNAAQMRAALRGQSFDSVIFFASLEHMTLEERLTAIGDAWAMLSAGGLLVVVETPNRLWFDDQHTARLPFYHWLPNELAYRYSKLSAREGFNDLYRTYDEASKQHFLRRGRGVSYHEFDLAIGPAEQLDVVSSLRSFDRAAVPVSRLGRRHQKLLTAVRPDLHPGFFEEYLDIIIRKR